MKLYKFIRKNYILLLILATVTIFLIKNTIDGFTVNTPVVGAACELPVININGTCASNTPGITNTWDTANKRCVKTTSTCTSGYKYYSNNKCRKIGINGNFVAFSSTSDIPSTPVITYPTDYHCPSGYTKSGNFMCSFTPMGTYKCPSAYSKYLSNSTICFKACRNNFGMLLGTTAASCKSKAHNEENYTPDSTSPVCSS